MALTTPGLTTPGLTATSWAFREAESRKARFDAAGIKYDLRQQAGAGTWQLFTLDPNGAKVELDFDPQETP